MPRIYDSADSPLDFCMECFPSEREAEKKYGNVGEGPDGRGNCFEYDAAHPEYDGANYQCVDCESDLSRSDNHPDNDSD